MRTKAYMNLVRILVNLGQLLTGTYLYAHVDTCTKDDQSSAE